MRSRQRGGWSCTAGVALASLLAVASASPVGAFERTQTCRSVSDPSNTAEPCDDDEVPRPLFWDTACAVYHIARSGLPSGLDAEDVYAAIRTSFETWNAVGCSYFSLIDGGFTNEDRVGYNTCSPGDNANIIIFRDAVWPHQRGALALTSVTYDQRSGEIVDADIELNNTSGVTFTTSDLAPQVNIDIQNTVTHEIGHFVGLDHNCDPRFEQCSQDEGEATMFATAPRGELAKRDLEQDDINGFCAIYPDGSEGSLSCDQSNVGFFEKPDEAPGTVCESENGCACSAASSRDGTSTVAVLFGLFGMLVLKRRRGSRSPRR